MSAADLMDFSPEIAEARAERKPIVALESTIITHGMPYPRNVETALMLEEAVRAAGATPATIAVIDGRFKVGLDRDALKDSSRLSGGVVKASRRDLAPSLRATARRAPRSRRRCISPARGNRDFRDWRHRRRPSRRRGDVRHFRRSRRTLAQQGRRRLRRREIDPRHRQDARIPGIAGRGGVGYRCDEFPAFYARSRGVKLDHRCDGLHDLARMIRLQREIGPGGLLIANPIPEDHALDAGQTEARIEEAVREAKAQGIGQKDVTPFLLCGRIVEVD